jgi:Fe-S-cluster containining protein
MAQSAATLRLTIGDLQITHRLEVPSGEIPAAAVVPVLQGLVNAVVEAAERQSAAAGHVISCRKGCAACCRQLVPVSESEAERLVGLIDAMPAPRRAALAERFAAAAEALDRAGLRQTLLDFSQRGENTDRELSAAYFALKVPCPFLEEESCSIHAERPLVCREYLVTSPAELCAGPAQQGVTPVPVPKVSAAARGLEENRAGIDVSDRWLPLALLLTWAAARPRPAQRRIVKKTGPEWLQRFIGRLGRK